MAIFDWRDLGDGVPGTTLPPLVERFEKAEGAVGVKLWRKLVGELRELEGQSETQEGFNAIGDAFDRFLSAVDAEPQPRYRPPTVFVSHQRDDTEKGERAAWEATQVGFDYWLDVHDPVLSFVNTMSSLTIPTITPTPIPMTIKAVLIAAIIEMGLLNSTHVVTMQTSKSRSSRWVPYEFGRAKHRHVISIQAASWFEAGVTLDPGGDYLSLGVCAPSKHDLLAWLDRQPGARRGGPNTIWRRPGVVPPDLPN